MTAEIAILNKSAVALAADSAVSIGRPPRLKIYNTVDKIFELSGHQPVGIMIYGGLEFMGLPLETIIKVYRKHLGTTSFPHVRGYRDHFRAYLSSLVPVSEEHKIHNVARILYSSFESLHNKTQKKILNEVAKTGFKKSKLNGIAQHNIRKSIDEMQKASFAGGFSKKGLPAEYVALVDVIINETFNSFVSTDTTRALLRTYAGYVLAKTPLSTSRTGIVIAGFGTEELCPTLERFEMDGFVSGRLKFVDFPEVDVGRGGTEAAVLGFAQEDMVKTFVDGVNPSVNKYLGQLMASAVEDTAKVVLGAQFQDAALAAALAAIEPSLTQMKADLKKKSDDFITKSLTSPVEDMVRVMPKQELSNLASSLIEITSLRRKVTKDQETVGGEVDVAIISKSEGFVWTKRKHYFKKELNPRFFVRHYQEVEP